MLTVLIHDVRDAATLAIGLPPLISGAVEGIVRDVVVLDVSESDARRLAEHAGCRLEAEAECLRHVDRLKGDWVLVLAAGVRLGEGWMDDTIRHVSAGSPGSRHRPLLLPEAGPRTLRQRLLGPRRGGRLLPKGELAKLAQAGSGLATIERMRPVRAPRG